MRTTFLGIWLYKYTIMLYCFFTKKKYKKEEYWSMYRSYNYFSVCVCLVWRSLISLDFGQNKSGFDQTNRKL